MAISTPDGFDLSKRCPMLHVGEACGRRHVSVVPITSTGGFGNGSRERGAVCTKISLSSWKKGERERESEKYATQKTRLRLHNDETANGQITRN